jgi:hypothetical protein
VFGLLVAQGDAVFPSTMKSLASALVILAGMTPDLWSMSPPLRTPEPLVIAFWGVVLLGLSSRLRHSASRASAARRAESGKSRNNGTPEQNVEKSVAQPA